MNELKRTYWEISDYCHYIKNETPTTVVLRNFTTEHDPKDYEQRLE